MGARLGEPFAGDPVGLSTWLTRGALVGAPRRDSCCVGADVGPLVNLSVNTLLSETGSTVTPRPAVYSSGVVLSAIWEFSSASSPSKIRLASTLPEVNTTAKSHLGIPSVFATLVWKSNRKGTSISSKVSSGRVRVTTKVASVGAAVGVCVSGDRVGKVVVGEFVGDEVGQQVVGVEVVGEVVVGDSVGVTDGLVVGVAVGDPDGVDVGESVGDTDGLSLGTELGELVGHLVGYRVGYFVGYRVG
mmetsp:Transcript_12327/g.24095  ORF Transcript_12327/g.24095 Transcript_12327/m.24095 type:complete len:245 (-) Transcript_12327:52-786(-)